MPPSFPFLPETIGRYEVSRVLGQGAMGKVLLARDPVLNRDVAIKVLRDDLGLSPEVMAGLVTRMRHEAQAAARVTHPNLVTLHDMGEDDAVGLYLVFEYVSGPNLKERLHGGRLPPLQVARLAREMGGALAVAHLAGVLHRDVKPENVILAPHGAKIADFGIAKLPDSTLTRHGSLIGTPAYSAPEALTSGTFSPESDQFSFAATLYEAASGERAFPGDDAVGVAAKIQTDEPRPIARRSGLPDEVDAVLLRAMSKQPGERFASTAELGEALATAIERAFAVPAKAPSIVPADITAPRPAGPTTDTTRVAIGAATIALISGLVGYAASQGTPFFGANKPLPLPPPAVTASATSEAPARASTVPAPRPRPAAPRDAGVDAAEPSVKSPAPPASSSP